jgi:hypothetical protein
VRNNIPSLKIFQLLCYGPLFVLRASRSYEDVRSQQAKDSVSRAFSSDASV